MVTLPQTTTLCNHTLLITETKSLRSNRLEIWEVCRWKSTKKEQTLQCNRAGIIIINSLKREFTQRNRSQTRQVSHSIPEQSRYFPTRQSATRRTNSSPERSIPVHQDLFYQAHSIVTSQGKRAGIKVVRFLPNNTDLNRFQRWERCQREISGECRKTILSDDDLT